MRTQGNPDAAVPPKVLWLKRARGDPLRKHLSPQVTARDERSAGVSADHGGLPTTGQPQGEDSHTGFGHGAEDTLLHQDALCSKDTAPGGVCDRPPAGRTKKQ